jgi:hypothetical protein
MFTSALGDVGFANSSEKERNMTDHRSRLEILDELSAPSLWPEIEARRPRPNVPSVPTPRRHVGTIAVALVIALAGTLFAVIALGPTGRPFASLDPTTWSTHQIGAMHLAFNSPGEWYVQPVEELVGHAGMVGSVVSNVDHRFRHPDLGPNEFTSAWELRGLPADAVVISIEQIDAIVVPNIYPDTELPLDISQAERAEYGHYAVPEWEGVWLPFTLAGVSDSIFVWYGPEATDHDREVAERIVASIRPTVT